MRYGGKKNLSSPSDKELKLKLLMFIPSILSVSVFFQLYLSSGFTSSHKKQQPQKWVKDSCLFQENTVAA